MAGSSLNADSTYGAVPNLAPVPIDVSATDSAHFDKVVITWTDVPEASSYRVFRNPTDNSSSATNIANLATLSFDDATAVAGIVYYYWVKSVASEGDSDFSDSDPGDVGVILTSSAGENGEISPAGTMVLVRGGSSNFVITADTYYHIDNVLVNSNSVGAVSNYLWTNITANGEITASFAPDLNTNGVPHWWLATFGFTNDFDNAMLFNSEDLTLAVAQGEANVTNSPNGYGLYTSNSVLDLGVGDIGVQITNGMAELSVQLWQTDDLITWTNIGGEINWAEPVDGDKKFFRIRAEP